MELKALHAQLKEIICRVDFQLLWQDFEPLKFALYNETECFFDGAYIKKTDAFIANTAIRHGGEYIAIWQIMDDIDPVTLASKLIHEMFHGFQLMNHETRFPQELDALVKYRYLPVNLSLKMEENHLIAQLVQHFDADGFARLLSIRKYRLSRFSYEYRYEAAIEQIEGTASYVELNVLKQLSNEDYCEAFDAMLEEICDPGSLLPIRIISYSVGALFFSLLKDNSIAAFDAFTDEPTAVMILQSIPARRGALPSTVQMDAAVQAYHRQTDRIVAGALADGHCVAQGEFDLLGLNVYNARYHDRYIVSYYFVMYACEGNETVLYGDFVIEIDESKKIKRIVSFSSAADLPI